MTTMLLALDLLIAGRELPPEVQAIADGTRALAAIQQQAEAAAAGATSVPRSRSMAADQLVDAALVGQLDAATVAAIFEGAEVQIAAGEHLRGRAVMARAACERAQYRLRAALSAQPTAPTSAATDQP